MPRIAIVVIAALVAFVASAALLLVLMPEPVEDADYLLAGSVATLVALLVLFLGLTRKTGDVFFKKRPKRP